MAPKLKPTALDRFLKTRQTDVVNGVRFVVVDNPAKHKEDLERVTGDIERESACGRELLRILRWRKQRRP